MARIQSSLIGSYPEYSGAGSGGATFPVYPVVNDAPYQVNPNSPAQHGDVLVDKFGNTFIYVRAVAGLTVGQVCKFAASTTGTVSANTTKSLIKTNITTTIREDAIGSFLTSTGTGAGTGVSFTKVIKSQVAVGTNTSFYISKADLFFSLGGNQDGDVLAAIPTTGDPLAIVRPYAVDVAGIGETPVGVALGTVTSGNSTLIQVGGMALVMSVANVDNVTDGGTVVTAAAGVVKGTLGTATAASAVLEAHSTVGIARNPYISTNAKLIPVSLNSLIGYW